MACRASNRTRINLNLNFLIHGVKMLLVEKYRPHKIEDVVGLKPLGFKIDQNLPHLLLHGPAGTGKTTLAKIIIHDLNADALIINASSERGIDVIRDKVKQFASTQSSNISNIKIVFLDEADFLTTESMTALRNTMETFASNCRFILTANYLNKIIDPIQSRCIAIEFNNIPKSEIIKRLEYICKTESISYAIEALNLIVDRSGSDIRRSINKIEELKSGVFVDKLKQESHLADNILLLLEMDDFDGARQKYLDAHPDNDQLLKDIYNSIYNGGRSNLFKQRSIIEIAETCRYINVVAWKEIQIERLFAKLIEFN